MGKRIFTLFIFALLLLQMVSVSSAQGCMDAVGLPIPCPTAKPKPKAESNPVQRSPNDKDGDGTPDSMDACPNYGGPAWNQGCQVGQEPQAPPDLNEVPVISLPPLPSDGECVLATLGTSKVNVRAAPEIGAEIVAQLDPQETYPVSQLLKISIPDNNAWYLINAGWVFQGVVRLGGDCSTLPTILARTGSDDVTLDSSQASLPMREIAVSPSEQIPDPMEPVYIRFCSNVGIDIFTGEQSITQCDNDNYAYDGLTDVFECDGTIYDNMNVANDCNERTSSWGTILNNDNQVIAIGILLGANTEGIDPPAEGCLQSFGFLPEGINVVGFNPQPEPPADPIVQPPCVLLMNDTNFGGEGSPVLLNLIDADNALLIHPPDPGIDFSQWHINILNGSDNPDSASPTWVTPPDDGMTWTEILLKTGQSVIVGETEGHQYVCPGSLVGFNPQPEPPALDPESANALFDGINIVGFNPQPEPPALDPESSAPIFEGISIVGFNPQPEPPAINPESADALFDGINIVGFNPQPEPPALCLDVGL